MSEHEAEAVPAKIRTVGLLFLDDQEEGAIGVDHIYLAEGSFDCEDCGSPGHDPGHVGLTADDGEVIARMVLTAPEALVLANRLQRAASLVLESEEQVPDIEREAARFAVTDKPGAS
jgi:hypothetical protein